MLLYKKKVGLQWLKTIVWKTFKHWLIHLCRLHFSVKKVHLLRDESEVCSHLKIFLSPFCLYHGAMCDQFRMTFQGFHSVEGKPAVEYRFSDPSDLEFFLWCSFIWSQTSKVFTIWQRRIFCWRIICHSQRERSCSVKSMGVCLGFRGGGLHFFCLTYHYRTASGNVTNSQTLQSGMPTDLQICGYYSNPMLSFAYFWTLRNDKQLNELLNLNWLWVCAERKLEGPKPSLNLIWPLP